MSEGSNERLLQIFSAVLILLLGWVLTTMIGQVKEDRVRMEQLLERLVAVELRLDRCEEQ